jgi:hypothetical protein
MDYVSSGSNRRRGGGGEGGEFYHSTSYSKLLKASLSKP